MLGKNKSIALMLGACLLPLAQSANAFVAYGDSPSNNSALEARISALESERLNKNDSYTELTDRAIQERINRPRPISIQRNSACQAGYIQHGKSPKLKKQVFKGAGRDLSDAANELIPSDSWRVIIKDMPVGSVAWSKKGTWVQALGMASASVGGCVDIDWKTRYVVIKTAGTSEKTITASNYAYDQETTPAMGQNESGFKPYQAAAPMPATTSTNLSAWILEPGKTLKTNLTDWAEKAGWRLVWSVKNTDFNIENAATITGSFNEAINSVMQAYAEGSNPLAANIYEDNKVVEIIDHVPFQRNTITDN